MDKEPPYLIHEKIDRLTNSIENTVSGDSFPTEIMEIGKADLLLITKAKKWQFDWRQEFKEADRKVYKLTIIGNPDIIQGLASISDNQDHLYLHLIENAPFNKGKFKLYQGVPGNLFAFACKLSRDRGYEGIVAFQSKTKLIEHYEKTLGATHIGGHKMIIFPKAALKLMNHYFKS